ncbi:MAG: glycerol-3-phosphate responsive antiterminator [Bacillota bacterium]
MPNKLFFNHIQDNPIIAAVNKLDKVETAIKSPCKIIFLLIGDIYNLKPIVEKVKAQGKFIYIHFDLIVGFSKDQVALKYMNDIIKPDGIITTKSNIVKKAKELDIFVIQRIFVLDSLSLESGLKTVNSIYPNAIEVLPGTIVKTLKNITGQTKIPVIASGLIKDKEDIIASIKAGVVGISSSKEEIWYM